MKEIENLGVGSLCWKKIWGGGVYFREKSAVEYVSLAEQPVRQQPASKQAGAER